MKIDFAHTDFGEEEKAAVNRVMEGYWLASGPENEAFEKEFATYVGTSHSICVASGSCANLLALASLNLDKNARVLTSACGFPATLSPILHLGLKPVLVDYDLLTHNINIAQALAELPNVQAILLAHTMGNPANIKEICDHARDLGVKIIEDCCEAAGTLIDGQSVGSFGDVATFSFYPSHQMTAGGMGGMVVTNNKDVMTTCKSFRDWGKIWNWDEKLGDNKTFYDQEIEGLEHPYYRHYTYQTCGYNFKLAEMNAAFGREQLKKLDRFAEMRLSKYNYLRKHLADLDDFIQLPVSPHRVSWFGYLFTLRDGSRIKRNNFGEYLESVGIRHRPFFAGNILKHKPFSHLSGSFPVADKLMRDSLFIGCHTKMTKDDLDYIIKKVHEYVDSCHS